MFEARLTQENGTQESREFADYDAMVHWLAEQPPAGMMVWEDGEDISTERFIQLQNDVAELEILEELRLAEAAQWTSYALNNPETPVHEP